MNAFGGLYARNATWLIDRNHRRVYPQTAIAEPSEATRVASPNSLDQFIRAQPHRGRNRQANRLRRFQVDGRFEPVGYSTDSSAGLAPFRILSTKRAAWRQISTQVCPIRDQPAGVDIWPQVEHRRQAVLCGQFGDALTACKGKIGDRRRGEHTDPMDLARWLGERSPPGISE
jgi:hypothetical protein